MANQVSVTALGGQVQVKDNVTTVGELATLLGLGENHRVKINRKEATYDTALSDLDFVAFGEKTKGGIVYVIRKKGQSRLPLTATL